jgi:hypothetical protein
MGLRNSVEGNLKRRDASFEAQTHSFGGQQITIRRYPGRVLGSCLAANRDQSLGEVRHDIRRDKRLAPKPIDGERTKGAGLLPDQLDDRIDHATGHPAELEILVAVNATEVAFFGWH